MRLKDKIAVITGGASGMGEASVYSFLKEGASVVIADFNEATGKETLEKMVMHLQALNDLATSEAGQRTVGGNKEVEQIKALLPWAQSYLEYWRS